MEQDEAFTCLHLMLSAEHVAEPTPLHDYFRQRYETVLTELADVIRRDRSKASIRADVDLKRKPRRSSPSRTAPAAVVLLGPSDVDRRDRSTVRRADDRPTGRHLSFGQPATGFRWSALPT